MSNLITGQFVGANPAVTNGTYTSRKAIFIVEPGQYQSHVEVEFSQTKVALADNLVPGQNYDVHINIRGSKNMMPSTKQQGHMVAFNSLQAWKVEPAAQHVNINPQPQGFAQQQQQAPPVQQGFGQPAPQTQSFAQPTQPAQGFGAPQGAPAPANFGAPAQGFGQPAPQQGGFVGNPPAQGFGQ